MLSQGADVVRCITQISTWCMSENLSNMYISVRNHCVFLAGANCFLFQNCFPNLLSFHNVLVDRYQTNKEVGPNQIILLKRQNLPCILPWFLKKNPAFYITLGNYDNQRQIYSHLPCKYTLLLLTKTFQTFDFVIYIPNAPQILATSLSFVSQCYYGEKKSSVNCCFHKNYTFVVRKASCFSNMPQN